MSSLLVLSVEAWECFPWATLSFELEAEAQVSDVMDSSLLEVQLILENFFGEMFKDQVWQLSLLLMWMQHASMYKA